LKKPKWFRWTGKKGMPKAAREFFDGNPRAEAMMEVKIKFGSK
jgi:hypothetical protein